MNPPDPVNLVAANKAAPNLDPQTIVASALVAQNRQDSVGAATATAAVGGATSFAQQLQTLSMKQQAVVWKSATTSQQQQWRAVGYNPPAAPIPTAPAHMVGGGLLHDVMGAADAVGGAISHGAGDVLNAVASPLRAIQHLDRAAQVNSEYSDLAAGETPQQVAAKARGAGASLDWNDFKLFLSPSSWSQAWRETTNGEKSFDPAITGQMEKSADPQKLNIAKQLASVPQGGDTSQIESGIVNSYPAGQRLQVTQMIASDPDIKSLTAQFQAAKLSPGRALVGQQFELQHPHQAKLISGGIDMGLDLAQDPTMKVGSVMKAADAAKFGISAQQAAMYHAGNITDWEHTVNAVADQSSVQRYFSKMSEAINSGSVKQIETLNPSMVNHFAEILKDNPEGLTPDKLRQWYGSQAGMAAILGGKAARDADGVKIFPHLSSFGNARMTAKGLLAKTIDFAADASVDADKSLAILKAHKLIPEDLAGHLPGHLAADGSLPADGAELATKTATPTTMLTKENVGKEGGFAATAVRGGISKVGRTLRSMTTLTTSVNAIDLTDPESVVQVRRMLQPYLDAKSVDKMAFVYANTPDIEQRFTIVKGAVDQMLHLAGIYSGADGGAAGNKIMDAFENSFKHESYAPNGHDGFLDGTNAAVHEAQTNHMVSLPKFADLHSAAKQNAFMGAVRVPVADLGERVMSTWRAGVLLNPHFPLRVAIDENLSHILRNGLMPTLAAHGVYRSAKKDWDVVAAAQAHADHLVATSRADGEAIADGTARGNLIETLRSGDAEAIRNLRPEDGYTPELHGLAKAVHILTDRIPPEILKQVRSVRDLSGAILSDIAWKGASPFMHGLTREDYHQILPSLYDHVWDTANGTIGAVHDGAGGYDSAEQIIKMVTDGKPTHVQLVPGHSWSASGKMDPLAKMKWQLALGNYSKSKMVQTALAHEGESQQIAAVKELLADPSFERQYKLMKRSRVLPDGRRVGEHGVTQADADEATAVALVKSVNDMVTSGFDGQPIESLVNVMKAGRAPSSELIDTIENKHVPDNIFGPDLVPVTATKTLIEKGFQPLSRMIDNLTRRPLFLHAYAHAYKEMEPWAQKLFGDTEEIITDPVKRAKNIEEMTSHLAAEGAMRAMKPFLHSPEVRSQFEVMHRTAMPFLFAQTQFLKRWTRTFVTNPDAIAKAQLAMNGMRTSGIVHTDSNGNDFFYYPGSQYVTDTLARAANAVGIPAYVPMMIPFTGQVKYLMPGISNPLTPSVGPTVAIPLKMLANRFPELQKMNQAILGPGASNDFYGQILPSTLDRVRHAISDNPNLPGQLSSSMMMAMQQLQSQGYGINPGSSAAQKQQYIDRVTNWSRINLFAKAIIGFGAPASPSALYDPKNFSGRLQTLLNELPYNDAIAQFLKEQPDASPYTVFASKSSGGAVLPASKAAGQWLDTNAQFAQTYQKASGWLVPRTTGKAEFDPAVYREQIQYGMRDQQTPGWEHGQSQFLDSVMNAPAAKTYFKDYQDEQAALKGAKGNSAMVQQIRSSYDQNKATFLAQNPAFADKLTSSASKANRQQTIWELESALTDPNVPKSPQTDHVREMVTRFVKYQQTDLSLQGQASRAARATRTQSKDGFVAWATAYSAAHPDVSDLFTTLLTPELTDTSIGLGSSTAAQTLSNIRQGAA